MSRRLLSLDLLDYAKKQIKFSLGNVPSIPIGIVLLYFFVQYLGIWYIAASLLCLVVTTCMNFAIQILLGVVKIDRRYGIVGQSQRLGVSGEPRPVEARGQAQGPERHARPEDRDSREEKASERS